MEFGLESLGLNSDSEHPLEDLRTYVGHHLVNTDAFFTPPPISNYRFADGNLSFSSPIVTETPVNNTVHGRIWETRGRERAVLILPHWNAKAQSYDRMAWWLRQAGIAALRLSLPYHDLRRPSSMPIAEYMVSANLGRTIRSNRQAVLDARLAIDWLDARGYRRIGIVGSSLGSSVASIVAAHDPRVTTLALPLSASHFGEVVWTGRATQHIRQAFEGRITLEELNELWAIISPINYVPRLKARDVSVLILSGREDAVFQPYLTRRVIDSLRAHQIRHWWKTLPCGHYTMAKFPFSLMTLASLVRFLRTYL
jgi:dienelactone hydrolase